MINKVDFESNLSFVLDSLLINESELDNNLTEYSAVNDYLNVFFLTKFLIWI